MMIFMIVSHSPPATDKIRWAVMRHEDYHKYEISNLYIQIARWCNQQQFYKKVLRELV